MNLDEQLLAQQSEPDERSADSAWAEKASRLREAQRSGSPDSQGATSLREAVLAEKRKEAVKTTSAETAESSAVSPLNLGTSKLLQQSWLSLIPSWGCTLIWINIHAFFLNQVFGEKYFCKLGDEWTGALPGAGGVAGKVTGAAAEAKPPVKPSLEIWGLIGCDLGCLFLLIAVASVITIIVMVITDPVGATALVGQTIADLFKKIFGIQ